MEEQVLSDMLQLQQSILGELTSDPDAIRHFRVLPSTMIVRDQGSREATNATCTAFCLYYLTTADLLPRPSVRSRFTALLPAEAATTVQSLGEELVRQHSKPARRRRSTSTGLLPNQYNSAIQVAGYLAAARYLEIPVPEEASAKCQEVVHWLTTVFLEKPDRGWVPRIEDPETPSSYLTFWTAAAIREWSLNPLCPDAEAFAKPLADISRWSEQELTNAIAYHYSGFRSRVDVVEVAYAILCSMTFGKAASTVELARRAVDILFSNYFDHGCFAPSSPVLADKHNFSLQCPTAEIVALLTGLQRDLLYDQWKALCTTYDWLSLNRVRGKGWIPESSGHNGQATAFMTTSALTFLAGLVNLLDDTMHRGACSALNVPRTPPVPPRSYNYPGKLAQILSSHVIQPLTAIPRKEDLASYSMILYGPPGTSKTTIARKLAADLGWPLLIINQNAFLQKGVANMDAEAERLFRLVGYLKDVVVLFDEVEELVGERSKSDKDSRILTTAMLPRIHYLRDRHRVVFIFVTNRLESIDNAASRLGRFDIVQGILPPELEERKHMLQEILKDLGIEEPIAREFEEARVAKSAEAFCYIDLYALVRHIRVVQEIDKLPVTADSIGEVQKIYERRVKDPEFVRSIEKVRENSKQVDRP